MNQCLSRCEPKCSTRSSAFRRAWRSSTGTKTFGDAEVAVVLRDLVLEDQVVAEGVPGELARRPGDPGAGRAARASRIEVRREVGLELLEELLDARRRAGRTRRGTPRAAPRRTRCRGMLRPPPRASSARSPGALSTTQQTRRSGTASTSRRIVPPQPISMSSECAPIASTARPSRAVAPTETIARASFRPGQRPAPVGRPRGRSQTAHGRLPRLGERLERLLVLERVHRCPEPVVRCAIRSPRSISRWNGSCTSSSPGSMYVEDVGAEDEVAPVDPDVGVVDVADRLHLCRRLERDGVEGVVRRAARRGRSRPCRMRRSSSISSGSGASVSVSP